MNKKIKRNIRRIVTMSLVLSTMLGSSIFANEKMNLDSKLIEQIESIEMYEVPSNRERIEAKDKYKNIIELINKYFEEKDIYLSGDINDIEYQEKVLSLGTGLEFLGEENKDELLEFVRFIDVYENIEKNNQINVLMEKYKNGSISNEEVNELINLAPISKNQMDTSEEPSKEGDIDIETYQVFANGYDNSLAVNYAYNWTDNYKEKRNTSEYGYYSISANDCTNFVSQCLQKGKMKSRGSIYTSSNAWFYNNIKPSHTWGGAQNFFNHWKTRAGIASSVSNLRGGDVVSADFHGDGDINHTAIITKNTATSTSNTSSHKFLTQHTADRKEYHIGEKKNYTLSYWYNSGYKVYGYEMDKASN